MSAQDLLNYNPLWEKEHRDLSAKFRAQWHAANQAGDDKDLRRALIADCKDTLLKMRGVRQYSYRNVADVALMMLERMRYKAMHKGIRLLHLPSPLDFPTIASVRMFYQKRAQIMEESVRFDRTIKTLMANPLIVRAVRRRLARDMAQALVDAEDSGNMPPDLQNMPAGLRPSTVKIMKPWRMP